MKNLNLLLSVLVISSPAFAFIDEAWEGFSAPEIMSSGFTNNFSMLPLEGQIAPGTKSWSSSYWPSRKAGIANRWNSPNQETFKYSSPSREQVAKMSIDQLKTLSPAEKYDLLLGDYSYPTKQMAWGSSSPRAKDWAGICHGWAPAAMLLSLIHI